MEPKSTLNYFKWQTYNFFHLIDLIIYKSELNVFNKNKEVFQEATKLLQTLPQTSCSVFSFKDKQLLSGAKRQGQRDKLVTTALALDPAQKEAGPFLKMLLKAGTVPSVTF